MIFPRSLSDFQLENKCYTHNVLFARNVCNLKPQLPSVTQKDES